MAAISVKIDRKTGEVIDRKIIDEEVMPDIKGLANSLYGGFMEFLREKPEEDKKIYEKI